jgi:multicomponent Na+:H+ antiporter subunit G
MINIVGLVFISIGLFFDFVGCLGLVRLPDVYNRLQASTKCITLGTCSILLGVLIIHGFTVVGIKAFLCMLFLILTSPVSAHVLARAAHKSGVKLCEKSVVDRYEEDGK